MITVGMLLDMIKFPPDFEIIYTDSDREYDEMFPHFISGMSEEFYEDIIKECPIGVVDFRALVIELDGRMVYDAVIAYRKAKEHIRKLLEETRGDVTIDFKSLYPNILDSPE